MTPSVDHKRQARNRGIRNALLTTVVARLSGVLLQVVSLPIAAAQLGPAGFSIYAMLGALLAAMTLSNLGISQATTLQMSRSLATNDAQSSRVIFLTSLLVVGSLALTVSILVALLVLFSPLVPTVFGQHLENLPPPTGAALFVCGIFLATQLLSVFEAAQLAQQRQHKLNVMLAIGTLVAAVAVWGVARSAPTVLSILVAVHVPVILFRALNAFGVWRNIAPRVRDAAMTRDHVKSVLTDGLRFVTGTTIANFLCHPYSVFAVGLFAAPVSAASFAAVMNALILASSFFNMISTPFRSALTEAAQIKDGRWVRRAATFMVSANASFGLFGILVFGVFGEQLFAVWYQGAIVPTGTELWGMALYFFVLSLEVSVFIFLSSIGHLRVASRWLFIKSVVAALLISVPLWTEDYGLQFWVLAGTSLVLCLVPLGVVVVKYTPVNRTYYDKADNGDGGQNAT